MEEYPTKYISPRLGRRLFDFVQDEEINLKNSLYDLAEELHFFDDLAEIYNGWLNQEQHLLEGESKYYALCSLARSNIYQACSSYCRLHFSSAMVAARMALDAAFYAEMMARGYLSEDQYLNSQSKRTSLGRTAWAELKKGNDLGGRVRPILTAMNTLSEHGAHPSPRTWANRIMGEKSVALSFFQNAKDSNHLKYHFLGILWYGGMALESFLLIGREVFRQDIDHRLSMLEEWKDRMETNKQKFGIWPS
ncbi:hypothetical protein V1291_001530 [Nitrobacteraceae bacterium AZCC 1564]